MPPVDTPERGEEQAVVPRRLRDLENARRRCECSRSSGDGGSRCQRLWAGAGRALAPVAALSFQGAVDARVAVPH